MNETLTITNERVDDIPLVLAHLHQMGIQAMLDEHFPTHGSWEGLSLGWVTVIWLSHILSQGDHRLNHVQSWAQKHLDTLQRCAGPPLGPLDFTDDRLAIVLKSLSDDEHWEAFEGELNRRLLRVYDLSPERVRLDSTTASGHWRVTEAGLFQFGHSKDHRPDLPQVKVMLSALDPLGMPVVTQVLPGQRADDPLYVPAIRQVREGLGRRGLLYVGDCKMASLETRAFVEAGGDFYLCPLSEVQLPKEVVERYLTPVLQGDQKVRTISREKEEGREEVIAEGYEAVETLQGIVEGKPLFWKERRLVVRSLQRAKAAEEGLRQRLAKAQEAIGELNRRGRGKKCFEEVEPLRAAAEGILARYAVRGLLQLGYEERVQQHPVRRYGSREAEVREAREVRVQATVQEEAVEEAVRRLGWRVYGTNGSPEQLSLEQGVLAYREEYLIERGFGRLKGRSLSLSPMYLERDDHVTGLIRLLSIGLRVLTLLEFVVRRRLGEEGGELRGLYAGNPKRGTRRPTAERLLEAFEDVTLTVIERGGETLRHLTPLSDLQQRILSLLDLPWETYTKLCGHSFKPP